MMEKFMEGMTTKEKGRMMEKMMPKIMMDGNMPMTGMMKGMQEAMEKGFKPWETCMRMESYLKDIAQTNREMLEALRRSERGNEKHYSRLIASMTRLISSHLTSAMDF